MNSRIVSATNTLYHYLILNALFMVTNLIGLFFIVTLKPVLLAVPFYMLAFILFMIAWRTILQLQQKLLVNKDLPHLFKTYFRLWWHNVIPAGALTLALEFVCLVLYVDGLFFSQYKYGYWMNALALGVLVVILLAFEAMIYASNFQWRTRSAFRDLMTHTFGHWFNGLLRMMTLLLLIVVIIVKPVIGLMVFPSVLSRIVIELHHREQPKTS